MALLLPGLFFLPGRTTSIAALLRGLSLAGLAFSVAGALLLWYDWALTGDALLQPFRRYDPSDAPRLPESVDAWSGRLKSHGLLRLWQLNLWLPLSVAFVILATLLGELRRDFRIRLCLWSFGALFAAYFFYWGDGVVQYGPRYLYESLAVLLRIGAAVTAHFGRLGWLMLLGVAVLNVAMLGAEARTASTETAALREIHVQAKERGLTNCVVFTPRAVAPMWGAPGGVTDFDADVLIVRDRGPINRELLRRYPGRRGYQVVVDAAGRRQLSALD